EISTLSLFPNPSKDKVTIGFVATANDNVTVRIFDVMGRQISQQNAATNEGANNIGVDVSQLANGYYFVQVDNGTMKQQGRFVVAH
ncbi:MAG TPA: T9SS type A sorting domain-containing protein, partial [Chitinophagales bacterium]|nr:T9SS type A sorting domain-containing protein [Chitinophagales bacterium]